MILADVLLDQFCEDFPLASEVYIKSDNAGSYHGNYCLKVLYNICKNKNIKLLRYDYNEPCCRKDQWDRESATAKSLFVDAGNDATTANEIYKKLQYEFGLKNASVGEIEYDNSATILPASKIQKISQYHSFQFSDAGIQMWRYFQVGESENIPFGLVEFSCEVRKVLPYSKADKRVKQSEKLLEKKKQKKIFDFFFCTEYGCNGMFSSQLNLDQHRLSGTHDYSSRSTSMDKVKHSFAEKIKQSSHFVTNPDRSKSITTNEKCYTNFDAVEKKKVGQSPNGKSSVIQKNRKAFS